jgi:hypothetical protein
VVITVIILLVVPLARCLRGNTGFDPGGRGLRTVPVQQAHTLRSDRRADNLGHFRGCPLGDLRLTPDHRRSEKALISEVVHYLDVQDPEAHPTLEQVEELVATEAYEVL